MLVYLLFVMWHRLRSPQSRCISRHQQEHAGSKTLPTRSTPPVLKLEVPADTGNR